MTNLSAIKQVRWMSHGGAHGSFRLIINRPGTTALSVAATDTLLLTAVADPSHPERYSPYLTTDLQLSKKKTTTFGRRALDDATVIIRDSIGYTGTVNSVLQSEDFSGSFTTFFDVWFSDSLPYKCFVEWTDAATGAVEISHGGWIDPAYNPSDEPEVSSPGTTSQYWLGSRTIKITALSNAQLSLTWGQVLAPYDATLNPNVPSSYAGISASDCQEGVPHLGFMYSPPGCQGKSNTRANPDGSSGPGGLYQAVPYYQLIGIENDPCLTLAPAAVWPASPWSTNGGMIVTAITDGLNVGVGYVASEILTVTGGTTPATLTITSVGPAGIVTGFKVRTGGGGYNVANGVTTSGGSGHGFQIDITSIGTGALWGPTGTVFIKIGTLLAKIAAALGLTTFTPSTHLKSALAFWAQKASGLNFPIDTAAAIPLDSIYVSLNVLACSHPYDGSLWINPAGYGPDTPVMDVVTGLCNFLLADFNTLNDPSGTIALKLKEMGSTGSAIPTSFIASQPPPSRKEPDTGPRVVQLGNRGDKLLIQSPLATIGDASKVEVPLRLHRIGTTGTHPGGPALDSEVVLFDEPYGVSGQAQECFRIVGLDTDGNPAPNPNVWKSLCYTFWFNASNTNVVYGTGWTPFNGSSWANSFYVVNACYKAGATPTADLQSELQGNNYFNSRDYHAVAFAALTLALPTVEEYTYEGVSDSSGSVQAISVGMTDIRRYGSVASQNWAATEVTQLLGGGETVVTWQAVSGAGLMPNITDLTHGPVEGTGGTDSSGTSGSGTSGVSAPSAQATWNIITPAALTANTNNWVIGETGLTVAYINSTSDVTLSGITGGVANSFLKLFNNGSHYITLLDDSASTAANRFKLQGSSITLGPNSGIDLVYDSLISRWRDDS